ncbi:MAG: hypothetical protein B7Z02_00040 [Rhodobacterales bacterium 32-67-9]|nr:MAG: hypothetical protein B7Z02_00040 [Rhodobacterales bacterium 32-67-9]
MSLFDTTAHYPAGPARRPFGGALMASLFAGLAHFRRELETEAAAPVARDGRDRADATYLKDIGVEIGF